MYDVNFRANYEAPSSSSKIRCFMKTLQMPFPPTPELGVFVEESASMPELGRFLFTVGLVEFDPAANRFEAWKQENSKFPEVDKFKMDRLLKAGFIEVDLDSNPIPAPKPAAKKKAKK